MSIDRQGQTSTSIAQTISIVALTAVVSTLATLGVIYMITNFKFSFLALPQEHCISINESHMCFFTGSIESDGMISVLSTFYTNLIVILIAILTIIGILSALSLRYSAKQHVEAELPQLTTSYFDSAHGRKAIDERVTEKSKVTDAEIQKLREIGKDHSEFISGFSERLQKLEYNFEEIDTGETVSVPNEDDRED
ncbi:hypothetical protein RKLH11_1549 [Rhodobacteraceae bacterium KLH11]|nr:hypothetical protein RKLH11_1549 [Rhodobacteraceae bacterium KLH11]